MIMLTKTASIAASNAKTMLAGIGIFYLLGILGYVDSVTVAVPNRVTVMEIEDDVDRASIPVKRK